MRKFEQDVGLVLGAFILLLALENVVVGIGYRAEFVGAWEMGSARMHLSPIALACFVPFAIGLVAVARMAGLGWVSPIACWVAAAGGVLGHALSGGRRLVAIRVPISILFAIAFGAIAWWLAKRLPKMAASKLAGIGVAVAFAAWLADALVLPRLYPAFHVAMFVVSVCSFSLIACVVKSRAPAIGGFAIAIASIVWLPFAAQRVSTHDNLRRVLLEHAPILGRSVMVASRIVPPPPLEEDEAATTTLTSIRGGKSGQLDWRGHDIVVVTIDALRADHLSSYGYARQTTPNIDALAAKGVRFEHAYCPTPHTSYSVASMMTGKYMKPLLALGSEDASDTWPVQLRRYGYRTGAFYPPAVFFIDEHRFRKMRDENLGFEYYKEEFARPELRREQITKWLADAPKDKPLFLWVHLFEPHEPYEMHAEHPFEGNPAVDAYDSEIATADAFVGELTALVTKHRPPDPVLIVSADHGEEHGDHGGRYHGTTVYEEQVRVPLVVVAPGLTPRVVSQPVQTIDLLPTTLGALDVPVPPRVRGRDLGGVLHGAVDEGLAFSETDDYTLVARGNDRLVCARKIASCTLFDIAKDPQEKQAIDAPARVTELRKLTAAIEKETGKVEASALPEALRRGLQGDLDAAEDVAPLLDDARVDIRRLAARCAYKLGAKDMKPQLERAFAKDEDAEVHRWSGLALARLGAPSTYALQLLKEGSPEERIAAALALAENGDAHGEAELVAHWPPKELAEARELLNAFTKLRTKAAVPGLVRSLEDVRLRPFTVAALAAIGDARAKDPILQTFTQERYLNNRPAEARALLTLGAKPTELLPPLTRFAGTPEPMGDMLLVAHEAKLLTADRGGTVKATGDKVRLSKPGPARLMVLTESLGGMLSGTVDGVPIKVDLVIGGRIHVVELEAAKATIDLKFTGPADIKAAWVVPRAAEIPPPPPRAWTPDGR